MRIFFLITLICQSVCAQTFWGDILETVDFNQIDLTRPVGAYKKLMEWKTPEVRVGNNDKNIVFECLIYKVPFSNEKGILKIYSYHEKGCVIGSHFQEKTLMESVNPIKLNLVSDYNGEKIQIISDKEVLNLYFPQGQSHKRWKTLSFGHREEVESNHSSLKEGDYCLKWTKDCTEEIALICEQCPFGQWMETLNYKECPSKVTAVCGAQSCGGKDQPACLKMISLKYPLTCEEALNFVTCGAHFIPHCEGTGEIICR